MTKRYPARFEEVLATHGIEWNGKAKAYTVLAFGKRVGICSGYEIAGIAIEAMKRVQVFYDPDCQRWEYQIGCNGFYPDICGTDEDFCKCAEKAIREVYK